MQRSSWGNGYNYNSRVHSKDAGREGRASIARSSFWVKESQPYYAFDSWSDNFFVKPQGPQEVKWGRGKDGHSMCEVSAPCPDKTSIWRSFNPDGAQRPTNFGRPRESISYSRGCSSSDSSSTLWQGKCHGDRIAERGLSEVKILGGSGWLLRGGLWNRPTPGHDSSMREMAAALTSSSRLLWYVLLADRRMSSISTFSLWRFWYPEV